jgi:hypothetical protein
MILRFTAIFLIVAFSGCGETTPMLEGHVILWRNVPQNIKKWPCTIVLRNTSDQPIQVAPASVNYSASYTYRYATKTDSKAMTIYSEPHFERDTSAKYPEQFSTIEPGGVIAIPMELVKLPEIADKSLDVRVDVSLSVYFEGKIRRFSITQESRWLPGSE